MKSRGFEKACKSDTMTYDNRTEDIQLSQGTTYRVSRMQGHQDNYTIGAWKEGLCNKAAVHIRGRGMVPGARDQNAYNEPPIRE